ncbi:MAG: DUF416 family protein [Leptospiraceae bacterium]|nr:DUF416 family protein [Leptospiraceae bacterium]
MDKMVKQQIKEKISKLSTYNQLAFGVMITERFLPNYFTFYIAERWGNPMILLNGIDLLKNIARQESYELEELELIDNFIEDVTPDMDDFSGYLEASLALDCYSLLYDCFSFVKDKDSSHIESCSEIAFGSLELFIQKGDNLSHDLSIKELEAYLAKDELIQKEIEYQLNLLDELTDKKISYKLYIEKSMNAPLLKC